VGKIALRKMHASTPLHKEATEKVIKAEKAARPVEGLRFPGYYLD